MLLFRGSSGQCLKRRGWPTLTNRQLHFAWYCSCRSVAVAKMHCAGVHPPPSRWCQSIAQPHTAAPMFCQPLHLGKSPRIPDSPIISGAARGRTSRHCAGEVCLTYAGHPTSPSRTNLTRAVCIHAEHSMQANVDYTPADAAAAPMHACRLHACGTFRAGQRRLHAGRRRGCPDARLPSAFMRNVPCRPTSTTRRPTPQLQLPPAPRPPSTSRAATRPSQRPSSARSRAALTPCATPPPG